MVMLSPSDYIWPLPPTSLGIPAWNHGAKRNSGSARGTLLLPEPWEPPYDDAPDEDDVAALQPADPLLRKREMMQLIFNDNKIEVFAVYSTSAQ